MGVARAAGPPRRHVLPRVAASTALAAAALALGACGNAVQTRPIPHNELEWMVISPYAVFWLGDRFGKLSVTEVSRDISGAFMVQYGECLEGGEGSCTPALRVVTSPDNSFVPGGDAPAVSRRLRDRTAVLADGGRSISIATGEVVLDIIADTPALAREAAETAVPINRPISPGEALPAPLPDTGFAAKPLSAQLPATVAPLR